MKRLLATIAVLGAAAAAGCSLAPKTPPVALYDLGPPPAPAAIAVPLRISDIDAPPALDSAQIVYRLQYADPYQPAAYRDSRWAAPPATMLAQRLRQAAARGEGAAAPTGTPARLVRIELDRFEQVFTAPGASRVVVQLRARVLDTAARSRGAPERSFVVERDAPSADAAGAARAMSAAVDELTRQLLPWAAGLP